MKQRTEITSRRDVYAQLLVTAASARRCCNSSVDTLWKPLETPAQRPCFTHSSAGFPIGQSGRYTSARSGKWGVDAPKAEGDGRKRKSWPEGEAIAVTGNHYRKGKVLPKGEAPVTQKLFTVPFRASARQAWRGATGVACCGALLVPWLVVREPGVCDVMLCSCSYARLCIVLHAVMGAAACCYIF